MARSVGRLGRARTVTWHVEAQDENANGVSSSSPRLRGTSYLGKSFNKCNQPQRGCISQRAEADSTPLGLMFFSGSPG